MVKKRNKTTGKMTSGSRNLVIMGFLSIVIALLTTGVALAIYHNSGDIYLDRSRPGYLPDEEEIEQVENTPQEEEYDLTKNTTLTDEMIDEYLKELQEEIDAVNAYEKPFSSDVLSDERLGIPVVTEETDGTAEKGAE